MEGIYTQRVICTINLARYLDENGVIPKYNLQYLHYFLGLEIEAKAHDALRDIRVKCKNPYTSNGGDLEVGKP